jgi:hypothetical protein
MPEETSRVTFGRVLVLTLVVLALAASAVLVWQRRKSQYHDALVEKAEALIASTRQLPAEMVSATTPPASSKPGRQAVMRGNQTLELHYYDQGNLGAVDMLDDGGRVARRDILVNERIRVRVFYNERKDIVRMLHYDEQGREIKAHMYVPFSGIRAGY